MTTKRRSTRVKKRRVKEVVKEPCVYCWHIPYVSYGMSYCTRVVCLSYHFCKSQAGRPAGSRGNSYHTVVPYRYRRYQRLIHSFDQVMFRLLILLPTLVSVSGMALKPPKTQPTTTLSRRNALFTGAATIAATTGISTINPQPSGAIDVNFSKEEALKGPLERIELLKKIVGKRSDQEVEAAIAALEQLDPSNGKAAVSAKLDGTWELIYSVNAEAFSPLLGLPKPIRPTSLQLVGEDAAPVVGSGRIAQVLNFPILPLSLILSSGTVPVESDSSVLEIFPPFRLEAKFGGFKTQIVESGSDADFRALNARTEEAQAAGRNMYKQRYLETTGKKGDLRISEVIAGDPVLVVSTSC